jgi:DNA-binding transcriptional LysR family regulator
MDHFKQIATFVHVAQRGSLSAAARFEGIATRRVSLTAEGTAFVEDCQRVLRELEDAEASVSAGCIDVAGHLRLTAPAGFGRKYVAPLVAEFSQRHPRVTVTLDLSDRLADLLAEGIDCALRFGEHADSSLVRIALGESRRVIVAAPAYLQQHARPAHPRDLARHLCLVLGDGATGQRGWLLTIGGAPTLVRIEGALACNDGAVLHDWALAGRGLAWRSMWEVADDLKHGRLVTLLDDYAAAPTRVYCVIPQRRHLPLRVRAFVDLLKDAFATEAMRDALNGSRPRARRR